MQIISHSLLTYVRTIVTTHVAVELEGDPSTHMDILLQLIPPLTAAFLSMSMLLERRFGGNSDHIILNFVESPSL